METWFQITLTILVTIPYASLNEWALHRYFMHQPVGKFTYAFKAHALVHHQNFKADHSYHLPDPDTENYKAKIPMAWWNGPTLVVVASIIPALIIWLCGLSFLLLIAVSATIFAYYGAYEFLHWCMHLPKGRWFERSRIFQWINGHHLLHHRFMNKNFNVVLPFADWLLGTLKLRSHVTFNQAKGPSIPNVQPIN